MTNESALSEQTLDRLPPQSLDSEQAVIGSLLVSGDGITRVVDILEPEYFYRKAHQIIYAAMLDLFDSNEPIDIVTVSQSLKDQGKLENVGGRQYITDLSLSIATTANLEYYAKIVQEKALLRHLIKAGTEIVASCFEEPEADVAIDRAEHLIFTLAQRRSMQQLVHIKNIVESSFQRIEDRYENRDSLAGVPTGFFDLDALTSGFQQSDLIIVAARPSMGKCLAFDSELVLQNGSIATIEEIYYAKTARLLTLSSDYQLSITSPSAFIDDGVKPVFRVTTELGRTIETTLTHPFLSRKGWLKLAQLKAGMEIAVPAIVPIFGNLRLSEAIVKTIAYNVGSGTSKRPTRLIYKPELIDSDRTKAKKETEDSADASEREILTTLSTQPSEIRLIPREVFRLERRLLAIFLNRIFALNGFAHTTAHGGAVVFCSGNKKLAQQIQHLLLRFGIIAKLSTVGSASRNRAAKEEFWIEVIDHLSLENFCEQIGIFGQEENVTAVREMVARKHQRLHEFRMLPGRNDPRTISFPPLDIWRELELIKGNSSWDSLAQRAASITSSNTLAFPRTIPQARRTKKSLSDNLPATRGHVYWDKIVSIEAIGMKQVYDLTIPETHNFVANDICVHNTAFCLNIAQHVAVEHKIPVAIFSLEMSKEQLVQRMLCSEASIDANRLRTGHLHTNDWTHLAMAMGRLGEAPVFIDDSALLNVLEIRAKCRRLKAEMKGLGLIIIDYIQLLQGRKVTDNRVQEVSEISRSLKTLAREINVPVIALSQLSRAVEARQNKRPMLSDLRESGSIEQDADVCMFIYRDDYYNPESDRRGEAEIIIAKQRNGPTGTVDLLYQSSITRFLNKVHNQYSG